MRSDPDLGVWPCQTTKPIRLSWTKFRDLARELEYDEDEEAFDERLGRIAKALKPTTAPKPRPTK